MEREKFGSRLGFILISAGCAIGLGNVWRFPFITGKYGGAFFVLIYLVCLIIMGIPVMTMEFSVGRASQRSIATSFGELEPKGAKWHHYGIIGLIGNFMLLMFYTTVAGWMLIYFVKMIKGDFAGLDSGGVADAFVGLTQNPGLMTIGMVIVVLIGICVCALGVKKGVERVTKVMMIALFVLMIVLVINSLTLEGSAAGLAFYLKPNLDVFKEYSFLEVLFAAMGQALFTLSLGIGSMAIFGSYIGKERKLTGEAINVVALDTFVAIMAGLIIFPACITYGVDSGSGPPLIFITLPNIFNNMAGGRIWGSLFFIFMSFAALSTVIAVFENIVASVMDKWGLARKKSVWICGILLMALSVPCILGFNLWSGVQPLGGGSNILDLEDFIVSNNLLPLGSIVYIMFCVSKKGWGFDNYLAEANAGKGVAMSAKLRVYLKYILPIVMLFIFVMGYADKFGWFGLGS